VFFEKKDDDMKPFSRPIQVTQAFLPPLEEYTCELKKIWESHWLTNQGSLHEAFKFEVANYLKARYTTLFVNGHLALDVAIKSLNLTGNVITTAFTFASTTHAIVMNGLRPKFCDITMSDYNMDADKIEELIDEKTSAILPVHVFGNPCNIEKIEAIARPRGLKVIYDAAHTFGVEVNGQGIGLFGDVSMFSLHATKVFNSIEGGILTYSQPEYERLFNLYKNFGITGPETVEAVGLNAKMNEFQAAMGLVNLRYVDQEIDNRRELVRIYRNCLRNVEGISFLEDQPHVKHNYAYFPILVDEHKFGMTRNDLYEKLKEYNVFTRKYFYPLVSDYACYRQAEFAKAPIPVAQYTADRVMTLPIYGELLGENVEAICEIIAFLQISPR
jgi:dTDP-4-amino-4,6-dideoxygalactose transaminase